jgi:hypothetical protein
MPADSTQRILIADDQPDVLEAIAAVAESEKGTSRNPPARPRRW